MRALFGDGKPHVQRGFFPSEGKRGSFTVRILFTRDAEGLSRSWRIVPEPGGSSVPATGEYAHASGRGRIVRIGGKAQAWSARLEGFVTRPGGCSVTIDVPVRVHSRTGDDLGVAHVPAPVEVGDVLELGHGPILLLRVVDLV